MSELMEPRAPSDLFDLPVQEPVTAEPQAPPAPETGLLRIGLAAALATAAGLVFQFPLWLALAFATTWAGALLVPWRRLRRLSLVGVAAAFSAKGTEIVLPQFSLQAHFWFFFVMLGVLTVFWGLQTDDL